MAKKHPSTFYFAYGSDMNPGRFSDRGVVFTSRELARLPGYEFVLNKVIKSNGTAAANIMKDEKSAVFGVLYSCHGKHAFEKLDRFNGVHSKQYHREVLPVYNKNEEEIKAQVYIACENVCRDGLKIDPDYFEGLLAAKDLLPSHYYSFLKSFENRLVETKARTMTGENDPTFYFAYGSNMNPDRMHDRGITFTAREVARLPEYELVLNKVIKSNGTAAANIITNKESTVFGVLYSCDDNHILERLDKFEGVLSKQYHRQVLSVYNENGGEVKAHVYIAHEKNCRDDLKINPEYLGHLLAAKDILPTQYYNFLKSFEERFEN